MIVWRKFNKSHMNSIEGILVKSIYDYWDYINYRIDGYWLDEKLDELYPGNMYKGLIPTLVYWMERKEEKEVVWKRILPDIGKTTICPILMCPDDNDFSCTLIVAEIRNCGDLIQWKQLGTDTTLEWDAEKVGSKVEWLDKLPELNFYREDYLKMLDRFKLQMEVDREMVEKWRNEKK